MVQFKVAVIIPVYNAGRYVRKAVESAVQLDEVGEVILIDDAYPDNALEVCRLLVAEYPKVKLLQHPNGENRGAGASRNLGIQNSTCEFVAFLDADDWYLPNRFERDKEIFATDLTADGVYGCTQSVLEKDGHLEPLAEYSTVNGYYSSEELQLGWLTGGMGSFTTNAITVRKSLFDKTGLFDTSLRLHQDSHMYHRFLWHGKIVAGEVVKPIAVRRKHSENRITRKDHESKYQFYRMLFRSYETIQNPNKAVYKKLFNRFIAGNAKSDNKFVLLIWRIRLLIAKPSRVLKVI